MSFKRLLLKLLKKLNLLGRLNLTISSYVSGIKVFIPIIQNQGYNNLYLSEKWMLILLQNLLDQKQGTFVDVGTNIGQTLIKVKSIDPNIRYLGFEPNPTCVFYMQKLIEVNKYCNTEIAPVGISNKSGLATLHFYHENNIDSSATMLESFRPTHIIKKRVHVPVSRWIDLKSIFQDHLDDIAILKVDVEGLELEVFQEFKSILSEKRPFIIFEVLPFKDLKDVRRTRQMKLFDTLKDVEYVIYQIQKNDNKIVTFTAKTEFDNKSDLTLCEYVGTPIELDQSYFKKNH